jgi:hypothetical protein
MSTPAMTPMDAKTAARILTRVPYSSRFPIGCLVPPIGLLQSSVRSLAELDLAMRPEARSLVGVHLERLAAWVESAVGDPGCAAAVREAARLAPSYSDACEAIQRVIAERVASARIVIESAGHGQAGEPSPG